MGGKDRRQGVTANRYGVSFWGDRNAQGLDSGDGDEYIKTH